MRKFLMGLLVFGGIAMAQPYYGDNASTQNLGDFTSYMKLDYMHFTGSHISSFDGPYLGVGVDWNCRLFKVAYGQLKPSLQLGTGRAYGDGSHLDFSNIELNMRYLYPIGQNLFAGFGAGIGAADVKLQGMSSGMVGTMQGSGELDLKISPNVYIGAQAKYQFATEYKNTGINPDNYRLGIKLGMLF